VVKVSLWCRRIIKWQSACASTNQSACVQPRHGRKQNDWLAYWNHVKLPLSRPLTQPTGACRRAQASSRKVRAKKAGQVLSKTRRLGLKMSGPARPGPARFEHCLCIYQSTQGLSGSLEMHLEAVIERVRRCAWRPLSCELRDALGGSDRAK
jgi:hypothetical protein